MIKKNLNSLEEVKPELRALKKEGYKVYPKDAIYFNQFGIIATKDNEESVWLCWSVGTEDFLLVENKTNNLDQFYSFFKRYEGDSLYRWDNVQKFQVGLMFIDWDHDVKISLRTHMRNLASSKGWGPTDKPKVLEMLNWYNTKNKILNERLQKLYLEL